MRRTLKKNLTFILIIISLVACRKEKPPVGEYQAVFSYDYMDDMERIFIIKISDVNRDEIVINDFPLVKNGKKIKGSIFIPGETTYHIQGKWSGKFLTKKYKIEGTFIEFVNISGTIHQRSGTFLITSYY